MGFSTDAKEKSAVSVVPASTPVDDAATGAGVTGAGVTGAGVGALEASALG